MSDVIRLLTGSPLIMRAEWRELDTHRPLGLIGHLSYLEVGSRPDLGQGPSSAFSLSFLVPSQLPSHTSSFTLKMSSTSTFIWGLQLRAFFFFYLPILNHSFYTLLILFNQINSLLNAELD